MTEVVDCRASLCRERGVHRGDCDGDPCTGCWPRRAADGLRLCWLHRDQLARNALRAGVVYAELVLQLDPSGTGQGVVVGGTRDVGIDLNPRAVEARDRVASVLASWAEMIADERGFARPARHPTSTAQFVSDNATWLAAHLIAGDAFDELWELAYGEPYRVACPSGTRVRYVGPCPYAGCDGEVQAYLRLTTATTPSEVRCGVNPAHAWLPHQYLSLARQIGSQRAAETVTARG